MSTETDIQMKVKDLVTQKDWGGLTSLRDVPYTYSNRREWWFRENQIRDAFLEEIGQQYAQEVPERYRDRVVQYAWEEGRSYGYAEVVVHLENIVEAIFA